jgi:putative restriction endonuclease
VVSVYIANTDNEWFDFLAGEPGLQEVNFWQPGGMGFHAIGPGELFAFRLKSPRNRIGGSPGGRDRYEQKQERT